MKNDERSVINFKEIFSLIFKKLWLIILFAVCGGIIAFCVSKFIMTPMYEAHVNLYVQGDSPLLAGKSSEGSGSNYSRNDVTNLKQLTNTYIEVLNDDLVMQELGEKLMERFGNDIISKIFTVKNGNILADELRDTIYIESVPDTLVLKLQAVTKDPEVSVAICNYFAVCSDMYLQKAIGNGCKAQYMAWAKYNDIPVSPNKIKNTALGAVSAILLALLLIFVKDFFDDSIRDVNVLSNRYGKAVIGEVGHFKGKNIKGEKKSKYVSLFDKHVPFTVVENYKAIRTSINYMLSSYDKKVISVSSAEPFEGKSVNAANIAITLAQGGNKVLLIDADLRNPAQHEIFKLSVKKGLTNVLSDISKFDSCIKKSFTDRLDILTAGDAVSNPSELVASSNMDMLIEKAEEKYNYIIIDTPAVNFFTESIEIAKKVSGMIIVTRYNETSSADIDSAISRVEFFEANILGFILNDIKNTKKYDKVRETVRNTESISASDSKNTNEKDSFARPDNNSKNKNMNRNESFARPDNSNKNKNTNNNTKK